MIDSISIEVERALWALLATPMGGVELLLKNGTKDGYTN